MFICCGPTKTVRLWELLVLIILSHALFDVLPVMTYLCNFREWFDWSRKKAVLQEWRKKGEITKQVFY